MYTVDMYLDTGQNLGLQLSQLSALSGSVGFYFFQIYPKVLES